MSLNDITNTNGLIPSSLCDTNLGLGVGTVGQVTAVNPTTNPGNYGNLSILNPTGPVVTLSSSALPAIIGCFTCTTTQPAITYATSAPYPSITFDTQVMSDPSYFTMSNGNKSITINQGGLYKFTQYVTLQAPGAGEVDLITSLLFSTTGITGGGVYVSADGNAVYPCSSHTVYPIASGTTISMIYSSSTALYAGGNILAQDTPSIATIGTTNAVTLIIELIA